MSFYLLQQLFLEITNQCPAQCRHCSSESSPDSKEFLSFNQVQKMILEGIFEGLECVSLSGGEPLLHPDYKKIIVFAKEYGLKVNVYSCGSYLSKGRVVPMTAKTAEFLKKIGLDKIIFSLHSGNAQTQEHITNLKESFACVMQSVKRCVDAGLETEVHYVPMSCNVGELENVVSLANSLGVKKVSVLRLVQQGRCDEELEIDRDTAIKIVDTVEKLKISQPEVTVRLGAPFNCIRLNKDISPCSAGFDKLNVSARGEVFPCEAFKWLKNRNLCPNAKTRSLRCIWNGDPLLNLLRQSGLPEYCKENCEQAEKCYGGCSGQRHLYWARDKLPEWLAKFENYHVPA